MVALESCRTETLVEDFAAVPPETAISLKEDAPVETDPVAGQPPTYYPNSSDFLMRVDLQFARHHHPESIRPFRN